MSLRQPWLPMPGSSLKRESSAGRDRAQLGCGRAGAAAGGICRRPPARRPLLCRCVYERRALRRAALPRGSGSKSVTPTAPHTPPERPELPRRWGVCGIKASLDRSSRGRSLARPRRRRHLRGRSAAGSGAERLRGRTPREAAGRGRPWHCPARLCAPRGAWSPVLVPGSCRCCQQKPRSKWMCGKLCPNLPVFGLFSAFLVGFLGSQRLILVALFR